MTFEDTPEASELRERLRAIIRAELTESFLANFVQSAEWQEEANAFCRRLARERLLTFAWPEKYGGAGRVSGSKPPCARNSGHTTSLAVHSTWESTGLARPLCTSGPTSRSAGTFRPLLPATKCGARASVNPRQGAIWRRGKLSAVRQPDGSFVANGQKIWTSYATFAGWCFLTTRTGVGSRKQQGITVFLVPMDRPGINGQEIASIMGPNHLNEVFFDDVVLSEEEILGDVDRGWEVIELVLKYERVGIARYARSDKLLSELAPIIGAATGPGSEELRSATPGAGPVTHRAPAQLPRGQVDAERWDALQPERRPDRCHSP